MKSRLLHLASFAIFAMTCRAEIRNVSMDGYIGGRVHDCIRQRVMGQDVDELIEPFLKQDEVQNRWASEFWGKWVQGAMASYQYNHDPALYAKIKDSQEKMVAAQLPDGYIGDYDKEHQLAGWDVWGRKYTLLGLVKWYGLTGDKRVLRSACKLLDYTMSQIGEGKKHIYETGYYRGMPPCSILEPVMYMYRATKRAEYLDFAKYIVADGEKSHKLVEKCDVPVAQRFPLSQGQGWWSFENGQKAYEMMSCYEGLVELASVTGNQEYITAAEKTVESIVRDEINIAGSGAAFECWYMGRERQTIPTYHTMETCVTFTWMQFCARLLDKTGNSFYADQFERTMYNALMAAMKDDGTQISKYSPLEGHRSQGEEQCGMCINCCNANGPRRYALIPKTALTFKDNCLSVNLYLPMEASLSIGRKSVQVKVETGYPVDGKVRLSLDARKASEFSLALRVPSWSEGSFAVTVNGETCACAAENGFVKLSRKWQSGDVVEIDMEMKTRVVELNNMQAVVRGPLVFARDSRFGDGFVDESAVIQTDEKGCVAAVPAFAQDSFCWLDLQVPMILGANLEDDREKAVRLIHFCDFASAGNDWDPHGRYRVWIPRTLHVMSEPYHRY